MEGYQWKLFSWCVLWELLTGSKYVCVFLNIVQVFYGKRSWKMIKSCEHVPFTWFQILFHFWLGEAQQEQKQLTSQNCIGSWFIFEYQPNFEPKGFSDEPPQQMLCKYCSRIQSETSQPSAVIGDRIIKAECLSAACNSWIFHILYDTSLSFILWGENVISSNINICKWMSLNTNLMAYLNHTWEPVLVNFSIVW